jgi:phospholipid transport system substrate-binding protein
MLMRQGVSGRSAFAAFAVLLAVQTGAEPALGPRATVEQLIEAVRTIKDEKDSALSPSEREHNQQAKRVASGALAIREVSEKALGDQWRKLTPAQQADFIRLVTDLFETVAYPKSSGFFGDLTIEFGDERITGERAVVKTTVRHPKEGRVGIDYKLERRGNQWLIHDILLDEVSLALDLRSQIQKVLREESYARLIERMREKLNEG